MTTVYNFSEIGFQKFSSLFLLMETEVNVRGCD